MMLLIVGAGSIGRRHISNLNKLGYEDIDVVDINNSNLDYARNNFRIKETFTDFNVALNSKDYDIAFILTPPIYHIPMALELARKGVNLFIEKPLSHNLEHVDELIKVKVENNLVVMVGYNQRFDFGLRILKSYAEKGTLGKIYYIRAEVGQYLPDWRPRQDYRKSYTAIKELGGGILLDGSHEIDYVMWLANSKIKDVISICDRVSNLEINVEDIAEAIFRFENGIIGSIHLNMIERGYNRYCKIMGEEGSVKWIFKDNSLEFFDGASKKLITEQYERDSNHSYLEELKHFFYCIEKKIETTSNLYTAKETLKAVMNIKEKGNENRDIVVNRYKIS
jgi:predicted dehydrogenase